MLCSEVPVKNPFRVYFWMLGQDARLGLLRDWGFRPVAPGVYGCGEVRLHQLGMVVEGELLYLRSSARFYSVPSGTLPPELPSEARPLPLRSALGRVLPHWQAYEHWVQGQMGREYRRRLLRLCPPLLRPLRQHWKREFLRIGS